MGILAKTLSFITIIFYGSSAYSQEERLAPRPVILELFTSQGCSSCPPADKVLEYYAENNPNVIALSMHVDYWNYIGWRDPFSSNEITQRQRNYQLALQRRNVYTPQMVIDGKYQGIGSRYNKINPIVGKALTKTKDVPISLSVNNNILEVGIKPHSPGQKEDADIVIIGYDRKKHTKITRGENSGESLTNVNVVRYIKNIGKYNGSKIDLKSDIPDTDDFVVILQNSGQKEIIGVGVL